jgi:hypothetical protein
MVPGQFDWRAKRDLCHDLAPDHTYTNPNTGESVVIQNTGVAKITDQGARGAGIDHFGPSSINHGWQDYQAGTVKGHLVDLCEVLG